MEQDALGALLNDLYIVGSVGPSQQLYTRGQDLYVASPNTWQSLYRLLVGESRHSNVERVHSIVRSAMRELRTQVHDLILQVNKKEGDKYERNSRLHDLTNNVSMLRDGLAMVRTGLANLATTYKGDKRMEATIRVIDKTIESELDLTKHALSIERQRDSEPQPKNRQ